MQVERLIAELREARGAVFAALDAVEPGSLSTPGLAGEWSARELIAHLGYWAGHATELIHAAEQGRDDLLADRPPVDEINETVARVARETDIQTVRRREDASVHALIERLSQMEPALLQSAWRDGMTLADAIAVNGPAHYREHADELRRSLDAPRD